MPVIVRAINSGTGAFTFSEVNLCYEALGAVVEEKKRDMDDRFTRDEGLIARWSWVGLRRAMDNSKVVDACYIYVVCVALYIGA